jgi:hypothetical protein
MDMSTFSRVAIALVGMTGLAAAQPKADPKPAESKAETKPPPELAAMAKAGSGTWHCKGQGMDRSMKMVDMTATLKIKSALNGWWINGSLESKMGKELFVLEQYTTLDPSTGKWKRIMIESGGNWASGESAGMKDGKVDWELTTHSPTMGDGQFRDHEDFTDPKVGARMSGELNIKGAWVKIYELACKK